MDSLNLPTFEVKVRTANGARQIFDAVRKKYVALTPEEWVRQHFIEFLVQEKAVPRSLIAVEQGLKYHQLNKRSDIVVHGREGQPVLLIECKAPHIAITQQVFDQIARYNMVLKVAWLAVTNGLHHYYCRIDHETRQYQFVPELPPYGDL
ncbi:MAG: type I restriction enzyme HsdR N-terminal domain-containing protein [Bacteroidota bacterium]